MGLVLGKVRKWCQSFGGFIHPFGRGSDSQPFFASGQHCRRKKSFRPLWIFLQQQLLKFIRINFFWGYPWKFWRYPDVPGPPFENHQNLRNFLVLETWMSGLHDNLNHFHHVVNKMLAMRLWRNFRISPPSHFPPSIDSWISLQHTQKACLRSVSQSQCPRKS